MPSIDQAILRKIDACDIFLADVTPMTTYQKSSGNGMQASRDVHNLNILLELGAEDADLSGYTSRCLL